MNTLKIGKLFFFNVNIFLHWRFWNARRWGITTSKNRHHPWYGFTQFKQSFGGEQVDYAGTWDLPINKSRYYFYKVIRKLNRLRRKLGLRRTQ